MAGAYRGNCVITACLEIIVPTAPYGHGSEAF
jgi:hypothetical protein